MSPKAQWIGDRASSPHRLLSGLTSVRLSVFVLIVCTNVHTIIKIAYQWNQDKAAANISKHGIDFADAVAVFSDDLAITIPDERFDEERFVTIGIDAFGRVLVVV